MVHQNFLSLVSFTYPHIFQKPIWLSFFHWAQKENVQTPTFSTMYVKQDLQPIIFSLFFTQSYCMASEKKFMWLLYYLLWFLYAAFLELGIRNSCNLCTKVLFIKHITSLNKHTITHTVHRRKGKWDWLNETIQGMKLLKSSQLTICTEPQHCFTSGSTAYTKPVSFS